LRWCFPTGYLCVLSQPTGRRLVSYFDFGRVPCSPLVAVIPTICIVVCDMRKSFEGLSGLGREPASGEIFIFVNRRRSLLKLLHWQPGGFVLYYKRLEQGTFALPEVRGCMRSNAWLRLKNAVLPSVSSCG
jgi:hypothetical protein